MYSSPNQIKNIKLSLVENSDGNDKAKKLKNSSSEANLFSRNHWNRTNLTNTGDRKQWFETRSMSCKNSLEHTIGSQNHTLEIENQIREMNIIDSYERTASMNSRDVGKHSEVVKDNFISKAMKSNEISSLKALNPLMKKSASNALFKFPLLVKSKEKKCEKAVKKLSNLQKYHKIRELQVSMFKNPDHKSKSWPNSSSTKSNNAKNPEHLHQNLE